MRKENTEKRIRLILKYLEDLNIQYLAYHFPVKDWDSPFLKSMKDEIIYTIEIKDGHIHWDKVKRSLEKIKNYDF